MFDLPANDRSEAQQAESALAGLRDVDGIWGSFALSFEGALLVWDVPRTISEETLDAVAPRLAVLREALASGGKMDVELFTLRFDKHRLCVGTTPFGVICVITAVTVNAAALRMAMNVTARRLTRLFAPQ